MLVGILLMKIIVLGTVYVQCVCKSFEVPDKPVPNMQTASWEAFGNQG